MCSLLTNVGIYVFVRGGIGAICFVSLLFDGGRMGGPSVLSRIEPVEGDGEERDEAPCVVE